MVAYILITNVMRHIIYVDSHLMIPPFHITLQISAVGLNQISSSAIEFDVYNRATNITYRTKKFWGGNIHKA
jgi:hypothetical protein